MTQSTKADQGSTSPSTVRRRAKAGAAPFSAYQLASAAAAIRELRAAIVFAQSEPEFFPAVYDEDTGRHEPQANYRPALRVESLALRAMDDPAAATMMRKAGWTYRTLNARWETMLRRLPQGEALHPRSWG